MGHAGEIATGRAGAAAETWEHQLNKIKSHLGGIKTDLSAASMTWPKKPVEFVASFAQSN